MIAVILVAGFGSRLKPLTIDTHKALLPIGKSNTLHLMITKLLANDFTEFIFVTGHFESQIIKYISENFSNINARFIHNDKYGVTNTGYSLFLTEPYLRGKSFVKLDGDVNFEASILEELMKSTDDGACYICLDKSEVDDEVIKAEVDENGKVIALGKDVQANKSLGESIGIERISSNYSTQLFDQLRDLLKDKENWQHYYEKAYDNMIKRDSAVFKIIDITGRIWVEMDDISDYETAIRYFEHS